MARFLTVTWGASTRNAQSEDVKEMLGLEARAKLPAEGMAPRLIQGIEVWVAPLVSGRKRHRVLAECPTCRRIMSAGRLHQHVCRGA